MPCAELSSFSCLTPFMMSAISSAIWLRLTAVRKSYDKNRTNAWCEKSLTGIPRVLRWKNYGRDSSLRTPCCCANFATKVDMSNTWSAAIRLPWGLAILNGGFSATLRNRAIYFPDRDRTKVARKSQ